jgi:predicted component of type VI protein secretion system
MKISLVVLSAGKAAGKALPITGAQFIIGRDPECNLRPASAMISKRHCAFLVKNDQVSLRDFDSTNGTVVNDQPIKGEVTLKDGDNIKVGPLSFKIVIEATPAPVKQPGKPTPPPPSNDFSDDDAAAAMLAFGDDGDVTVTSGDTGEAVPGGSTVMDMPAFGSKEGEESKAGAKPDDKKSTAKKNHAAGAAQDAAKAILDKLRTGRRKTP